MIEVAANLISGRVDRLHLKAGSFELFLGNHQLLHAARRRQFAGRALLIAVNAQEADEDDEHNHEESGEVGNRGEMDRDRAACSVRASGRDGRPNRSCRW